MSGISEHQLIERCRQGDDEAFRELVDQHKRLVFALISRGVSNQARVEDLAQEVFLRIYRGLPYFRGEAKLSTWIFRIVSNVIAEERKPGLQAVSLDDPLPGSDMPSLDPSVIDRAYDELELRDRLEKAIERLPASYQLLVNGHYLEGMRYEDLVLRFTITATFGRRCIPPRGVASPSNTPGILGRRALRGGRLDARIRHRNCETQYLAVALQMPMGTVKTHLHRAKRLLRQVLERDLGPSS